MSIILLNVSIRLPSSHSQSLKMSFLLLATATTERKHEMNYDVFLPLKIVFNLANSADLDEMPPYVAFHLGLHCLPKYLLTSFQNKQVKRKI